MFDGDIYPGDSAFNSEDQITYGGRCRGGDLTSMSVGDPAYNSLKRMVYGGLVSKAALKKAAKAWDKAHRKRGRKGKLPRGVTIGPDGKFRSAKRGGRIFGGDMNNLSRGVIDMNEIADKAMNLYVKYVKERAALSKAGIEDVNDLILIPEMRNLAKEGIKLRNAWKRGLDLDIEYTREPPFGKKPFDDFLNAADSSILLEEIEPSPAVFALKKANVKPEDLGKALREGKEAYEYATNPFSALLNRLNKTTNANAPPTTGTGQGSSGPNPTIGENA